MEFRLLRADEIECRVSTVTEKGCSLLLYKDARCDMNILDETVGAERWKRKHEIIGGNLFCNVGILCETGPDLMEWIWKQDVGVESYTEKEKGQASDAFKRACFNWGLGRELYTAPFIWIDAGNVKIDKKQDGKFTTFDRFEVKEIGYSGRKISRLVIYNKKLKRVVYDMGKPSATIDEAKIRTLKADIENGVVTDEKALFKFFGVKDYSEITETQFRDYVAKREER